MEGHTTAHKAQLLMEYNGCGGAVLESQKVDGGKHFRRGASLFYTRAITYNNKSRESFGKVQISEQKSQKR